MSRFCKVVHLQDGRLGHDHIKDVGSNKVASDYTLDACGREELLGKRVHRHGGIVGWIPYCLNGVFVCLAIPSLVLLEVYREKFSVLVILSGLLQAADAKKGLMVRINNDSKQREEEGGRRNGRRRLRGNSGDQGKEELGHSNKFVSEGSKPPRMRPFHVTYFQEPQEREKKS